MLHRARFILIPAAFVALAGFASACEERYVKVEAPKAQVMSESLGNGARAEKGRVATINFKLVAEDGKTVYLEDDSFSFEVGANAVIRAVDDAVIGMRVGGRRVIACPPESHWGRAGYGGKIPPNALLRLEVELLAVQTQ